MADDGVNLHASATDLEQKRESDTHDGGSSSQPPTINSPDVSSKKQGKKRKRVIEDSSESESSSDSDSDSETDSDSSSESEQKCVLGNSIECYTL